MIRRILISSTFLAVASVSAFAQNNVTVVREAVPAKSQPIVANSPQDIALQEEIRRIRAYNAQVDSQVGISDTHNMLTAIPATSKNKYEGATVKLFAPPSTTITYASTPVQQVPATITTARPTPTYTRIHRVVEDDTLYNLARRNCVSVADIQNQNGMGDTNIRIGQAITLPASQCGITKSGSSKVISATAPIQSRSESGITRQVMPIQTGIKVHKGNAYAVLPKDSLYSIGKRYCLKAEELAGYNGIDTATPIQPGQILRLPATACN